MDADLREIRYDHPDAIRLTDLVQVIYVERYGGPGDVAPIDAAHFLAPHGYFVMAYVDEEPAAMGGWRRTGEREAEIKRMYVRPEYQGLGLARLILAHLEQSAATAGFDNLILETGTPQPEAIALYRSSGYDDVPAFGFYKDQEESVHLGKSLR